MAIDRHLYRHLFLCRIRARRVAEQGGRCCYCRRPCTKTGPTRPTIEHRKAKMDGGSDDPANLAAACRHCNERRGAQMNHARQLAAKGREGPRA